MSSLNDSGTIVRIGPNAITRVAEALIAVRGSADAVFAAAGLTHHLADPPETMVDERDVTALQQALRAELEAETAAAIAHDAGLRTGDYLLAHRIPKPAQRILKLLPSGPASGMLLKAVGKHAWTFSGSGHFSYTIGRPVRVRIEDCPLCRGSQADVPICDFYRGAFERLFTTLVNRRTQVTETQCQAMGADACIFEMRWS
ncbi:bacteriochlorophyll 4-vinyl reductase [Lamprobacter modestohalophilus]|uniref:Bacteriochlorophyll 4-vinyl reductase n=1 Tax=Lamprobacter modestohalophilus TaxID=1064514 RepID=A0A9X0WA36_9GAMM|nr:bacteriochlorophyll 4-vinyl reductase [Lamprobacter modestohalophilus]MBK1619639.1 bacteriochlorophyll 4-vinyl reductase [Lamprobacter modestohalophilus]